jgi:hypothetical protein
MNRLNPEGAQISSRNKMPFKLKMTSCNNSLSFKQNDVLMR